MSAEVKILVEGLTTADSFTESGQERTQPTITLIKDDNFVMVVDPGILEDQQILIDALNKEGLSMNDVNIVCITHSHIDHYRNIGMFPEAKVLEYFGLWAKNSVEDWKEQFSTNVRIIHTPGHDYTSLTLFVTTKDGVVAVCGDIFWKENYPKNAEDDVYASNLEKLKESRKIILKTADWIIPGHGAMYKNTPGEPVSKKEAVKKKESKITIKCKKCKKEMNQNDKCLCRPHLCFRCCECGFDCPACSCSHKG